MWTESLSDPTNISGTGMELADTRTRMVRLRSRRCRVARRRFTSYRRRRLRCCADGSESDVGLGRTVKHYKAMNHEGHEGSRRNSELRDPARNGTAVRVVGFAELTVQGGLLV